MAGADAWQPLAVARDGMAAMTLLDLRPGQCASSTVACTGCGRREKSAFPPKQKGGFCGSGPLWRGIWQQTTLPTRFPSPPTTGFGPWLPASQSSRRCPDSPLSAGCSSRLVPPRSPPSCRRSGSKNWPTRPCRRRRPSGRQAMPPWDRRPRGCVRPSCRSTRSSTAARAGMPGGPTSTGPPSRRRPPPVWPPTLPRCGGWKNF